MQISVKEYGRTAAQAPTVVLVHGWPDNAGVWNGVIPYLSGAYHVVNYDPRGSGPSGHPGAVTDYSLELLSRDFEAVINAKAPGKAVHVLAHDWGSIQTWESARRIPGRFSSFTSISGPSLDLAAHSVRANLALPPQWPALLYQAIASSYVTFNFIPNLSELLWGTGLGNDLVTSIIKLTEGGVRGPYEGADGASQTNLYRANILDRLVAPRYSSVNIPVVQQIVPTNDLFVTPVFYKDLEDKVPSLWRRSVQGGHWVVLTAPQVIAEQTAQVIEFREHGAAPPAGVVVP